MPAHTMENPENKQTSQTPDDPAAELAPTGPEEQPIEEAGTRNTGAEAPPAQESGIPEDTSTEPPLSEPEIKKITSLYDEKEEGKCRNCGHPFDSEFCPHCGQTSDIKRLTFANWKQNILDVFLSFDGTLIRTLRMLFVRPARMIKEYITGQRKDYRNPFTLLIILCTLYGAILFTGDLIKGERNRFNAAEIHEEILKEIRDEFQDISPSVSTSVEETSDPDSLQAAIHAQSPDDTSAQENKEEHSSRADQKKKKIKEKNKPQQVLRFLAETLTDSFIARCILMIPFYALFTRLLFRKKAKNRYNYTEILFATTFITCQKVTIDILLLPWEEYTMYDTDTFTFIAYILFPAWVYKGLFDVKWWTAIWKSVSIYILALITVLLCLLIPTLLIMYTTGYLGPGN